MTSEPNINTRSQTDLDLVKRAQEGDADAFASLFYAHKARIYSVCLRMTNNTAEAEDLTQDAFLQVFRKLETFRGDSACQRGCIVSPLTLFSCTSARKL